jgi:hypothetical protein
MRAGLILTPAGLILMPPGLILTPAGPILTPPWLTRTPPGLIQYPFGLSSSKPIAGSRLAEISTSMNTLSSLLHPPQGNSNP